MEIYTALCSIAFFAGFVQGLTGFGSVLFSLPLLALFLDIKTVIPLMALCGVVLTFVLIIQLHRAWEWKKIYPLLIGTIPGVPAGVYLLKYLEADPIHVFLGLTLICYSAFGLFFRGTGRELAVKWAYIFGFLAGCLGGALSASGPPVIAYTSLQPWEKDKIKITLQGYFLISGLFISCLYIYYGLVTPLVSRLFVISIPFLVLGTLTGSLFYGKLADASYRKLLFITLALLGLLMLIRGI